MSQSALILTTLLTTLTCFVAFGTYSVKSLIWKRTHKEATFPGAGFFYSSPAQVTEKYQLSIYPAPWAISIIWPTVLLWNVAAMAYLLYKSLQGNHLFDLPTRTYMMWTGAWLATTVWTFLFDAERHLATFATVLIVVVLACKSSILCCRQWNIIAKRLKSGNSMNHPFRYLVLEAHAVLAMWSVVAFAISIGYALAYKNSLHQNQAIHTGILTPEESATAGAIFVVASFLTWWILDVAYWRQYTSCIKSVYPLFAWVMLSLGLSNYSSEQGMTLNNMICFGTAALAVMAALTRGRAKQLFNLNVQDPMSDGDERHQH